MQYTVIKYWCSNTAQSRFVSVKCRTDGELPRGRKVLLAVHISHPAVKIILKTQASLLLQRHNKEDF